MLLTDYQTFIHVSRYSRYLDKEHRREIWPETVKRYFDFLTQHLAENSGYNLRTELREELEQAVLNLEIMPSMRALMTAGKALARDNVCGYNCAYLPINSPRSFDELFYILLCGTGVGYSVERQYINELPTVSEHFEPSTTIITVDDSKAGWARAFKELIAMLYVGQIPAWDASGLRPAGARLKTFGGRASGPGPLIDLFKYTVALFRGASGRQLTSIECHDLCCKIASVVVVGGVRRSAMISLSNLSDQRMRDAKTGSWFNTHPDRAFSNNSVAYTEKPDMATFIQEWKSLYDSHSGERGIFYRNAARSTAARNGRRITEDIDFGTNPCCEIILRPFQFCNLSEVVVRAPDTIDDVKRKVRLATILGTFQSTLTNFKYLRKIWKDNTEEERLLGVSLTGIMDHPILSGKGGPEQDLPTILRRLKDVAIAENKSLAADLGINQSVAITCVKPSGTVSQLVNSSSGIHPRHSRYYIRRVRGDTKDPLTAFLRSSGVPVEECAYKPESTVVFSFPVKSDPKTKVFRDTYSALQSLNLWLLYQTYWCEHKPSVTISVKEHEWMAVGAWVYENFDKISGISFLPYDGGSYTQAPYEEITEDQYNDLASRMPKEIEWSRLSEYETEDSTVSSQTLACTGEVCEIVDIERK
jgi:ribonucleoside-triphosphate reductase